MSYYFLDKHGREKYLSLIRDLPSQIILLTISSTLITFALTSAKLSIFQQTIFYLLGVSILLMFFYSSYSIFSIVNQIEEYHKDNEKLSKVSYYTELILITLSSTSLFFTIIVASSNSAIDIVSKLMN